MSTYDCEKIRMFNNDSGICWFNSSIIALFFSDKIKDILRPIIFNLDSNGIPVSTKFKKTKNPMKDIIIYLIMEAIRKGIKIVEEKMYNEKSSVRLRRPSLDLISCDNGLGGNLNKLCNRYNVLIGQSISDDAGGEDTLFVNSIFNYYGITSIRSFTTVNKNISLLKNNPMINLFLNFQRDFNSIYLSLRELSEKLNYKLPSYEEILQSTQNRNPDSPLEDIKETFQNILRQILSSKEFVSDQEISGLIRDIRIQINSMESVRKTSIYSILFSYRTPDIMSGHAINIIKCGGSYYFYDPNLEKKIGDNYQMLPCGSQLINLKDILGNCQSNLDSSKDFNFTTLNYIEEDPLIISYGGNAKNKILSGGDPELKVRNFLRNIHKIQVLGTIDDIKDIIKECNGYSTKTTGDSQATIGSIFEQFLNNMLKECNSKEKKIYLTILLSVIPQFRSVIKSIFTKDNITDSTISVITKIKTLEINSDDSINFKLQGINILNVVKIFEEFGYHLTDDLLLYCNNLETFKYLVSKGLDINVTNDQGMGILHNLLYDHRIIDNFDRDFLLKEDIYGNIPIFYSSTKEIFNKFYSLMTTDNLLHKNKQGQTFLIYNSSLFSNLLDNGELEQDKMELFFKIVELNDDNGKNLLHYIEYPHFIKILCQIYYSKFKSIDNILALANKRDNDGKNFFDICTPSSFETIFSELSTDLNFYFKTLSLESISEDKMDTLLNIYYITPEDVFNIIGYLVRNKSCFELVKYLLDKKPDLVNEKPKYYETLFHLDYSHLYETDDEHIIKLYELYISKGLALPENLLVRLLTSYKPPTSKVVNFLLEKGLSFRYENENILSSIETEEQAEAIKNLVGESNFNLLKEEILAKEDTNEYLKLLLQKIGGFRYPVQYLKN